MISALTKGCPVFICRCYFEIKHIFRIEESTFITYMSEFGLLQIYGTKHIWHTSDGENNLNMQTGE